MKCIPLVARLVLVALLGSTLASPTLLAQRRTTTATVSALPTAAPQSVGFAPDLPAKMDAAMQGLIDSKHVAGIVSLVARNGKVAQYHAYGFQDLDRQTPIKTNTIANVYLMSTPVKGVAVWLLYGSGMWNPSYRGV